MGRSNKPAKWFNAMKKAFRSTSKQKHSHRHPKAITDEKLGPASSCNICTPSATHAAPTPLPLPSIETITFNETEYGDTQKQPLPKPEAVSLANSIQFLNQEEHMEEEIGGYSDEEEEEDVLEEGETRRDDVIEEVDEAAFLDKQDEQEGEIIVNGVESAHGEDINRINYVSEEDEESEASAARIQQHFEGPLALGGLIRLQALVRGHRVRRQAATTLRAMQALVRVQARVRGHQFRRSKEGQAIQESIKLHRQLRSSRPSFKAGDGHWDTSRGSVEDRDAERSRWEIGARKTERAKAYAFSQQLKKKGMQSRNALDINCEPDQPHWGWTWLERWTHARPWELTHQQQHCHQSANSRKDYNDYDLAPTSTPKNLGYTTGKKEELDASTWKESYFGTSPPITSPHDIIDTPTEATTKSIFNSPRALSLNLSPQAVLDKRDSGTFSTSPVGTTTTTTTTNNSGNFPSSPVGSRAKSMSPRAVNISTAPRALSQSPREISPRKETRLEQHYHPLPLPLPLPVPVESAASNNNKFSTSLKSGGNINNFGLIKPPPIEVPAQYPVWEEEETQEKVVQDEHEKAAATTVFEPPEALPNLEAKPASEKLSSNFTVSSSSNSPAHSSSHDSLPLAPASPQGSDTSLPVPETPPETFFSEDHDLSASMDHLMLPESATSRKPRKSLAANGAVIRRHIKVDSPTNHKQSASDSKSAHTSNGHRDHRSGEKAAGEFNGDNSPSSTTKPIKARYMAPTESAKAKFRSSSNPKTRSANLVESPTGKQAKRYSLGGQVAKIDHTPKTAVNTQHQQRNSAFQTRGVSSPKVAHLKEKSPDMGAADSPARRNSLGGTTAADGIYGRWRT